MTPGPFCFALLRVTGMLRLTSAPFMGREALICYGAHIKEVFGSGAGGIYNHRNLCYTNC